jgi:transcriptional regulator with XRE-family HTH domain
VPTAGSTVVRRQLGRRLRRLREESGKAIADVSAARLASPAKLWRIETGKTPVKVGDVRALCWLYGADPAVTELLAALAAGSTGHGWWEEYGSTLPQWFGLYLDLEAAASELRTYDVELVHGLLQTPEYAQAVIRAVRPSLSPQELDQQVGLRMERQRAAFDRVRPVRFTAVLGAGTLERQVGGPEVMARQRAQLLRLSQRDHIEIRVLPWKSGAHPAIDGGYTWLRFDDPDDPDLIYLETRVGAHYLEQPQHVHDYGMMSEVMYSASIPIEEHPAKEFLP